MPRTRDENPPILPKQEISDKSKDESQHNGTNWGMKLQSWSNMGAIFSHLVPTLADFTFLVKTRHEMRNKSLNWVYFTINFKLFLQSMWSLCLYLTPTVCMTEWHQATCWKVGRNRPIGPMLSPLWRAWSLEVAMGSTPIGPVPKHSSGMSIVDSQY